VASVAQEKERGRGKAKKYRGEGGGQAQPCLGELVKEREEAKEGKEI